MAPSTISSPEYNSESAVFVARKTILVTGGAGFIGAHLVGALLEQNHKVIVVDSLWTGSYDAISKFENIPAFQFIRKDVVEPFSEDLCVDEIYHLACPASPDRFDEDPLGILETCFTGSKNVLELAKRNSARVLITSTSEVYGSSLKLPQVESDWGNVNPCGPRSCYDEGKRVMEALAYAYRGKGVDVRIARIFNTYGPGLLPKDGRVVSNFISAAILGRDLVIYGDGTSTRCFQYVSDCVRGLLLLMASDRTVGPVNIGTESEETIESLACTVRDLVANRLGKPKVQIKHIEAKQDDPLRRKPDITLAQKKLGWSPQIDLHEGLAKSIEWYIEQLV